MGKKVKTVSTEQEGIMKANAKFDKLSKYRKFIYVWDTIHNGFEGCLTDHMHEWIEKQPKRIRNLLWRASMVSNDYVLDKESSDRSDLPAVKYPKYCDASLYDICNLRAKYILRNAWIFDIPREIRDPEFFIDRSDVPYPYDSYTRQFMSIKSIIPPSSDSQKGPTIDYKVFVDGIITALDMIRTHDAWLTLRFKISICEPTNTNTVDRFHESKIIECSWTDCNEEMTNAEMLVSLRQLLYAVIPSELGLDSYQKRNVADTILGYTSLLTDNVEEHADIEVPDDVIDAYLTAITKPIIIPDMIHEGSYKMSIVVNMIDCIVTEKSLGSEADGYLYGITQITNNGIRNRKDAESEHEGNNDKVSSGAEDSQTVSETE